MSESEFELYLQLLGKFLRLRPGQRVEIADELRDHLEARLEELSRSGLSRADAVRRALDEFGDAACLADHFSQLARERKRRFLMRCTLGTVSVAAVILISLSAMWPQQGEVSRVAAPSAAWAKPEAESATDPDAVVNKKLDEARLSLDFLGTTGSDVVDFLRMKLEIDIVTAKDAADALEQPITLSVKHTQLSGRSALQLVLDQMSLSYLVRDGIVHVRLPDAALATAMVDVGPLMAVSGDGGTTLIETIQKVIQPQGWEEVGGMGTITVFNGLLIVRHTPDVIGEVHRFIDQLRTEIERREK